MKVALILTEECCQFELFAETELERAALKVIAPGTLFRAGRAQDYAPNMRGLLEAGAGPEAGAGREVVSFTYLTTVPEVTVE